MPLYNDIDILRLRVAEIIRENEAWKFMVETGETVKEIERFLD